MQNYNDESQNQIKILDWKLIQKENIIDHMVDTVSLANDLIQKVDARCDTKDLIEKIDTCDAKELTKRVGETYGTKKCHTNG